MEKICIFDEFGDRYEVTDIKSMLNEMPDEGLEVIYKPTRYFHEFNKELNRLVDEGVLNKVHHEPYDEESVERGLLAFEEEIIKRFGEKILKEWQDDTDKQWENNKPKFK